MPCIMSVLRKSGTNMSSVSEETTHKYLSTYHRVAKAAKMEYVSSLASNNSHKLQVVLVPDQTLQFLLSQIQILLFA